MSNCHCTLAYRRLVLFCVSAFVVTATGCRSDTSAGSRVGGSQPEEVQPNPNFVAQPRLTGYISAVTLSVRDGAGTGSGVVGYLFKGDRVDVYETAEVSGATWYRVNDEAGYVDGWVSGRYVSGQPVPSDFVVPSDYGLPVTPTTTLTNVSAPYVGVQACIRCHSRADDAGRYPRGPYGIWSDHYHADAYRTLQRPYTRALARRRGVQNPVTDARCVKCHVAAFGVPASRLGPNYRPEDGVSCEVCHGPGGDYLLNHWEGTDGFAEREAMGFRVYRNIAEREQVCRSCHNTLSPTYKPFNVAAFSEAIRHWGSEYTFVEQVSEEDVATTPPQPVPVVAEPPPEREPAPQPVVTPPPPQVRPPAAQATPPPVRTPPREPPPPAAATPPPPATPSRPARTEPPAAPEPVSSDGPDELMLDEDGRRGRVFFPHRDHHVDYVSASGGVGVCQVCHHTTEQGEETESCGSCHEDVSTDDTPNAEKAFHNSCRACHRELQAGPTKCSQCHER